MHDSGGNRQIQGLGIHMREHQDIAAGMFQSDAGDETVCVEFWREGRAFFQRELG